MHGRVARSASLVSAMSPRHKLIFIAAAILAASPATEGIKLAIVMQFSGHCLCVKCAAGELESQCVSDGTLVQFNCPVDGFDADDYISWLPEGLVDYEDYSTTATLMAEYSGQGYAIHEVTCDYQQDQYYHAVIIITGETHIMHSILVSVYLSHFLYAHIINTYTFSHECSAFSLPISFRSPRHSAACQAIIAKRRQRVSHSKVGESFYNF